MSKWHGYYMEAYDCKLCLYAGKKGRCKLDNCLFEEEKHNAVKAGRIKRARGIGRWDA